MYRGNPSYEEARRDIVLGVDLLAAEYAGFASYERILEVRGEDSASRAAQMRAEELRRLIESRWWDPDAKRFHAFLTSSGAIAGYGDVNVVYWHAVGERSEITTALKSLERRVRREPPLNIEVQSHFAEALYHYGVSDVTLLMGIDAVERPRDSMPEVTRLPTLGNIRSADIRSLPLHRNLVSIEHVNGGLRIRLTNETGPALPWRASFRGACRAVLVNGRRMAAHPGSDPADASTCSVDILVPSGGSAEASLR